MRSEFYSFSGKLARTFILFLLKHKPRFVYRSLALLLVLSQMASAQDVLMGLTSLWNISFLGYPARAILPYCQVAREPPFPSKRPGPIIRPFSPLPTGDVIQTVICYLARMVHTMELPLTAGYMDMERSIKCRLPV